MVARRHRGRPRRLLPRTDLGPHWDVNKPHKEMRAFSVPKRQSVVPCNLRHGTAAFLDTTLSWKLVAMEFPSEYCHIDIFMNARTASACRARPITHHR